jgi:putative addiction module component (TIGR02574 family)
METQTISNIDDIIETIENLPVDMQIRIAEGIAGPPTVVFEIIQKVRNLPMVEQAKIRNATIESYRPTDPEVEKAWAEEIKRRIEQVESGEVEGIPYEQVKKELFERLYK